MALLLETLQGRYNSVQRVKVKERRLSLTLPVISLIVFVRASITLENITASFVSLAKQTDSLVSKFRYYINGRTEGWTTFISRGMAATSNTL